MDTNQAADSLTFTQRPTGLHDEFEMVRSEFQRAQATLTKSISETMAAVDDFGAKQDRFERQLDGDLSLIQSKLEKLSRAQVQQVSTRYF
jgi:hypothetical protein